MTSTDHAELRRRFAYRLLTATDARGKRINQMANSLMMSDRTLYNYCYGSLPKVATLYDICEYLNISADYLLGRTDKMEVDK